jgi:hypothetical protein
VFAPTSHLPGASTCPPPLCNGWWKGRRDHDRLLGVDAIDGARSPSSSDRNASATWSTASRSDLFGRSWRLCSHQRPRALRCFQCSAGSRRTCAARRRPSPGSRRPSGTWRRTRWRTDGDQRVDHRTGSVTVDAERRGARCVASGPGGRRHGLGRRRSAAATPRRKPRQARRRRMKVIANAFGERPVLKLM